MAKLEIDGKAVEVRDGAMVMEATNALGIYVPHFCYHKKLTIAANCRMCLVEVEKAPKPLPACATPVSEGMKVWTHSAKAVAAQKGVMEFLLINHPLDCPICDQGGECQLQDLAVGYGGSESRFDEMKRVVPNKNLGPLISTDMTRCIHCTRCVRFGQEIAGVMELGMAGRGEHSEIMPFVARTVDSELSGNMIDVCPVGALTSKPFRYTARTWELTRRKSVSPHCSLGANLVLQVKGNRVMRVVPLENEAVNECWLSDKDRYSYEALNSEQRLVRPLVKRDGQWQETDWQGALAHVAQRLKAIAAAHGPAAIGALATPHQTLEELHLLAVLMRGLGSENIDHRLRQRDFRLDAARRGALWLGLPVAAIGAADSVLVIGSVLRKDHPLIAQRLRQSTKKGARLHLLNPLAQDAMMPIASETVVQPSVLPLQLAAIVKAVAAGVGNAGAGLPGDLVQALQPVNVDVAAQRVADDLLRSERALIWLGNLAEQHPRLAELERLAQALAAMLPGARFGFLGMGANSVGATLARAFPGPGGLDARAMIETPRKAYVLLGAEPELDCADGAAALAAMKAAEFVVALSPFEHRALDYAEVILPVAPFSETAGTFISAEGRAQSFTGVVKPLGDTRPAWKVLRVLGNLLGLPGFDQESAEAVRTPYALQGLPVDCCDNALDAARAAAVTFTATAAAAVAGIERVAPVRIHDADALVRRAPSLQKTQDAAAVQVGLSAQLWAQHGFNIGDRLRLRHATQPSPLPGLELPVVRDPGLPEGCLLLPAATEATYVLGAAAEGWSIERVPAPESAAATVAAEAVG
jgi:NADH-quinone oxidoreductase subunit G